MSITESVFTCIQEFKFAIDEINTAFLYYCEGWNVGRLPKHGKLNSINYQFHGVGCRAEKDGIFIDYDYQYDRVIGVITLYNVTQLVTTFDLYRFYDFMKSHPDYSYLNFTKAEELEPFLDQLITEGKLERYDPWRYKFPTKRPDF